MKKSVTNRIRSVILPVFILVVLGLSILSSCEKECAHSWKEATCTEPRTCTLCGATEGTITDHVFKAAEITKEAGCTENGESSRVCTVCGYKVTETITAVGHSWNKESVSCTDGRTCSVCGLSESMLGHSYTLESETKADCTKPGTKTYKCSVCNDQYTETTELAKGHSLSADIIREDKTNVSCAYVQIQQCSVCKAEFKGAEVYHHSYTASVTKEASCVAAGVKTFTCTGCKNTFTEAITKNGNAHTWDNGTLVGNIRTLKCTNPGCKTEKTVVDATAVTKVEVKASDLASAGEIQLKNAGIDFGSEALNTLKDKNVTVSSDVLAEAEIKEVTKNLPAETRELLGENPTVYDFKITESGNAITDFGGEVTVTIPYTLKAGENVDNIAVLYMSGATPELIKAEYSNGNIIFKTTHFSYYTVGQISSEDRCKLYGHTYDDTDVPGDCTTDSYKISVCRYCNDTVNTVTKKATGHDYAKTTTAASCTEDGSEDYKCRVCGAEYSIKLNATGHDYVVSWEWSEDRSTAVAVFVCKNDNSHTVRINAAITETAAGSNEYGDKYDYAASVSFDGKEYEDKNTKFVTREHEHSFGEWTETVAPSCIVSGLKERICSGCSYSESETLPATGHDYATSVTAPSCTEEGYTTHTCSKCQDTYTDTFVSANGHTYGEWTTVTAAGCTTEGLKEKVCTVCNDKVSEKIAAEGHDYKAIVTDPTCTTAGYTTHTCTKCQDTYTDAPTAAKGHTYGDWITVTAAGCTTEGLKEKFCTICNDKVTEKISATGHSYGNWTTVTAAGCTTEGLKEKVCTVCNDKVAEKIAAEGHDYKAVVTDPTCTTAGYTTHTCTKCQDTYTDTPTAAKGHTYGEWTTITAAGCTTEGLKEKVCTVCNDKVTEKIAAEGHDYKAIVTDPTCTTAGYTTHTCTKCQDTYTDTPTAAKGHTYGDWTTVTAAGCTTEGLKEKVCTVCNDKVKEKIVAEGHDYKAIVTDPTCTTAGYTTHTCTKCQDTYTDTPTAAKGHDYKDTVTYPSCTAKGYTTHTCSRCGDTYTDSETEMIEHQLVRTVIDLSDYGFCGGKVVLNKCITCRMINDFTVEDISCTFNDVYTENSVTSTCTKCSHILYYKEYNVNETTCTTSALVDVILKNENGVSSFSETYNFYSEYHNYTVASSALIDGNKGCTGGIIKTYLCSECGKSYSATEYEHAIESFTELDKPDGTCLDGWSEYEKCLFCEVYEPVYTVKSRKSHYYIDHPIGKVTLLAEFGDGTSTCEGAIYANCCMLCNTPIDYSYEGECTFSLSEWAGSDSVQTCRICNSTLNIEPLSSSTEGCFTGKSILITIKTAEGKEVFTTTVKDEGYIHNYEIVSSALLNPDESCEEGVRIIEVCKDCGYTYDHIVYRHSWGVRYQLAEDSESCLDGIEVWYECKYCGYAGEKQTSKGHYLGTETVNLSSSSGLCSGELDVQKCLICGDISGISRVKNSCAQVVSFGGKIVYYYCDVCKRTIKETRVETESDCTKTTSVEIVITDPDDQIEYSESWTITDFQHSWKVTSSSIIDSALGCEGGVNADFICSVCGVTKNELVYGHNYSEKREFATTVKLCACGVNVSYACDFCGQKDSSREVTVDYNHSYEQKCYDLAALGVCDGCVYYKTCSLCGDTAMDYECTCHKLRLPASVSEIQNGTTTCPLCGTTFTKSTAILKEDSHNPSRAQSYVITNSNGEILLNLYAEVHFAVHTLEFNSITFNDNALGCEGGGQILKICSVCGYRSVTQMKKHSYTKSVYTPDEGALSCTDGYTESHICEYCGKNDDGYEPIHYTSHLYSEATTVIDLTEYGFCKGTITLKKCLVCGNTSVSQSNYCFKTSSGKDTEGFTVRYCKTCGNSQKYKSDVTTDGCTKTLIYTYKYVSSSGTELLTYNYTNISSTHEFIDSSAVMNDAEQGCEGGYSLTQTCSVCGYIKRSTGNNHTYLIKYVFNDEAEGCESGWTASRICKYCGKVDPDYNGNSGTYHTYKAQKIDLTEYGFCSGTVTINKCSRCNAELGSVSYCCSTAIGEDSEGFTVESCGVCGNYVKYKELVSQDGCSVTENYIYNFISSSGTVLNQQEWTERHSNHNMVLSSAVYNNTELGCESGGVLTYVCTICGYESETEVKKHSYSNFVYKLQEGATVCNEGYTVNRVCLYCGKNDDSYETWYYTAHIFIEETEIDFTEYGFCSGTLNVKKCQICGYTVVTMPNFCCQNGTQGADGFTESSCGICGNMMKYKSVSSSSGCHRNLVISYKFISSSGTELLTYDRTTVLVSHKYKISSLVLKDEERGCDGGYTITQICNTCKHVLVTSGTSHSYVTTYVLNDQTAGCAGGWITKSCCEYCLKENPSYTALQGTEHNNKTKTVNLSTLGFCQGRYVTYTCSICGLSETKFTIKDCCTNEVGTDSDGYSVRSCGICGNSVKYKVSTKQDGCLVEETYTGTFIYNNGKYNRQLVWTNNYEVHDTVFSSAVLNNQELGCEGGLTLTYVCRKCGKITTKSTTNHLVEGKYTLNDETVGCAAGWTYSVICKYCGKPDPDFTIQTGTEHKNITSTASLIDFGLCRGTVTINECQICGYTAYGKPTSYCCNTKSGKDSDGYTVISCGICGTVLKHKATSRKNVCTTITETSYVFVSSSGITVLTCSISSESVKHTNTITVRLDDPSAGCTAGYTRVYTCSVCGEVSENRDNSHIYSVIYTLTEPAIGCEGGWTTSSTCRYCGMANTSYTPKSGTGHTYSTKKTSVALSSYGFCSGILSQAYNCLACGQYKGTLSKVDCCTEFVEVDDEGYTVNSCGTCGNIKKYKTVITQNGCVTTTKTECVYISSSGIQMLKWSETETGERHSTVVSSAVFDDPSIGCKGGVTVTEVCSVCGLVTTEHRNSHGSTTTMIAIGGNGESCTEGRYRGTFCDICGIQVKPATDITYSHMWVSSGAISYGDNDGNTGRIQIKRCIWCNEIKAPDISEITFGTNEFTLGTDGTYSAHDSETGYTVIWKKEEQLLTESRKQITVTVTMYNQDNIEVYKRIFQNTEHVEE